MNRSFFVLSLLVILTRFSIAQWSTDPNINNAICTATGNQTLPKIVGDSAGGAIITWYDERSGIGHIYAQRINVAGVVQWTANGVAICTAANGQGEPTLASDGVGGAIIAWSDSRNGTTNLDIYAQRLTPRVWRSGQQTALPSRQLRNINSLPLS